MSGGKYDSLKDKIFNAFKSMKDLLDDHLISGDHDDRYYQRGETDTLMSGKTDISVFNSAMDNAHIERLGVESRATEYTIQAVLDGINTVVKYNPVIVEDPTEVEYQKGQEESFSDVFANWLRISHGANNQYPSNAAELTSWAYDSATDQISCTVNSGTLVGFISLDRFDDYNFEVHLNSTASDDDQIGLCAAFTELDGREYTLTILRNPQGNGINAAHRFQLIYNYRQSDETIIAETSAGLTTVNSWSETGGGCKIRIERRGDVFTFKTTDNGAGAWVPAAELSIDISNRPLLTKFRGPQQYGYVAFSQANSTWDTLARPITLDEIVDIQNGVKWNYDGNDWVSTSISGSEVGLESKRFYFTEQTQKLYFTDEGGNPRRILLTDHENSDTHDGRYYTRNEIDVLVPQLAQDAIAAGHNHPWSNITSVPATASRWPTWTEVSSKPGTFPPSAHNHDGLYHTKSQINGLLGDKVDAVAGKGLSSNDFTNALKSKVDGIETGAEANLPTTASRTSTSTGTVLQAKAMNDHRGSSDHDGRYYTKSEVNSSLGGKVSTSDIVNALTSTDATKVLSAAQGKSLKDQVDAINTLLQSDTTTLDSLQEIVDFIQLNRTDLDSLSIASIAGLQAALNEKVVKVSGKGLTSNDFTNALKNKLDAISAGANNYTHPSSSFTMAVLNGATVISDINVDATGHISSVSTRNISKAQLGLGNVANVDTRNASNLSSGTVPTARLTGSYNINISGTAAVATTLATARTINGVAFNGSKNITIADNTKVSKSGDTISGRLNIGGTDDGLNELQVDGESSLRGNVGVNNSDPTHALDVDGDVRVRDGHAILFGGTGANYAKFEIRYNPATQSLDFNYLG